MTTVEDALVVVPDMASAFGDDGATFDQLFEAHYAHRPSKADKLPMTGPEQAALAYLYAEIRRRFEEKHGRIVEEYWCTEFPAAAVVCFGKDNDSEFWAIVNWKQDDATFVEQMFDLDDIDLGTCFLAKADECRRTHRLIFDAYSSALDALETRRAEHLKEQAQELELVKKQVELARKFFRAAGQRYAQAETLRGLVATLIVVLSIAAVVGTFFWAIGVGSTSTPARLLSWAVAGAIGACLSVIVRIARDEYTPNWEASKEELQVAGAIRPLVGVILGAAVPVLVISGLQAIATDVKDANDLKTQFVFLGLALAAGFSERWAQDLISKQPSVLGSTKTTDTTKADGTATAS